MTKELELKIAAAKLAQMTGAIHPGEENIVAILAKQSLPENKMIEPPEDFDDILKAICREFAVEIFHGKRMDIRERTAAIAILIKARELWETKDESSRGSAVKRYEGLFAAKKADDQPGGETIAGPDPATNGSDDDGDGEYADEPDPELSGSPTQ